MLPLDGTLYGLCTYGDLEFIQWLTTKTHFSDFKHKSNKNLCLAADNEQVTKFLNQNKWTEII